MIDGVCFPPEETTDLVAAMLLPSEGLTSMEI